MFLIPKAGKFFTKLRQAFVEASILNHFDPKRYIQIEMDTFGYIIGRVFSQLISDDLGQWHLIVFFFKKMIPAKTWYETHHEELLAIVEAFKTWKHYLKGYKYKVLVPIDHNNFQCFMNTKNLSFRQV